MHLRYSSAPLVVRIIRLPIVWFKARSPFVLKHTTSYALFHFPRAISIEQRFFVKRLLKVKR